MGIESITGLIGGLGLFLVGMWLMTEGLKVAAGPSLKMLLERWTNTRAKGLATGFALTALVQSSSAVTVAAIGFVNAGVLTLGQAGWVIFGSNVGTTMTGWIVALVGFKLNVEAFLALPLIGLGMGIRLVFPGTAKGALGEALAGFGLFFLGVSVLKETFEGIAAVIPVETISGGYFRDFLFVLAGFAITALAQSSSASIAVALSAVSGGLIGLETGAAMVIGANLGTTVTGMLAVLNATSNAKRVAASHVVFNLMTGALAFLILPGFIWAIRLGIGAGLADPGPAATLLFWCLGNRLLAGLEVMFTSQEESEARPRYLDKTLHDMPSLAAASLLLELRRFGGMTSDMVVQYLKTPVLRAAQTGRRAYSLAQLSEVIGTYAAAMSAARMPDRLPDALAHALRALQHYNGMVHELQELMDHAPDLHGLPDSLAAALRQYRSNLEGLLSGQALADTPGDGETLSAKGAEFEAEYQRIKDAALSAASRGGVADIKPLDGAIREADLIRRISHHAVRAAMRIKAADSIVAPPRATAEPAPVAEAVARNE